MSSKITFASEKTITVKKAETITGKEFEIEFASVNLAMKTANVTIKGHPSGIVLHPAKSGAKSAAYLAAEALVHTNLAKMAKEAIGSGDYS